MHAQVLVYEDLVADLRAHLPTVASFMGLALRADKIINEVAEMCTKTFMSSPDHAVGSNRNSLCMPRATLTRKHRVCACACVHACVCVCVCLCVCVHSAMWFKLMTVTMPAATAAAARAANV